MEELVFLLIYSFNNLDYAFQKDLLVHPKKCLLYYYWLLNKPNF